MKIKLLSSINYDGKNLEDGSVVEVEQSIGEKWIAIGAGEVAEATTASSPLVATPLASESNETPATPSEPEPVASIPQPVSGQPTEEQIAKALSLVESDLPSQTSNEEPQL
jgi:hypothetical protein